jgi:hypothetical protein
MQNVEITYFDPYETGFILGWASDKGFGEFSFTKQEDGRILCDNECMGSDSVRSVLTAFADYLDLRDGQVPGEPDMSMKRCQGQTTKEIVEEMMRERGEPVKKDENKKVRPFIIIAEDKGGSGVAYVIENFDDMQLALAKMVDDYVSWSHFTPCHGGGRDELDFNENYVRSLSPMLRKIATKMLLDRKKFLEARQDRDAYVSEIFKRIIATKTVEELFDLSEELTDKWSMPHLSMNSVLIEELMVTV